MADKDEYYDEMDLDQEVDLIIIKHETLGGYYRYQKPGEVYEYTAEEIVQINIERLLTKPH